MKISVTQEFVLPADVKLTPESELNPDQKELLNAKPGQVALTRRRSRMAGKLLDGPLAELLGLFRNPRTITDAIAEFSERNGIGWEAVLEQAYPKLRGFVRDGILVITGSPTADEVIFSLTEGDSIEGCVVQRRVHLLEDTEVYCVKTPAGPLGALKLIRPDAHPRKKLQFLREAAVLRLLPPHLGPRLLLDGSERDLAYLAIEWIEGSSATYCSSHLRRKGRLAAAELLACCHDVIDAYARLHEANILHGDVHPGNVLILPSGKPRLIDFGVARASALPKHLARAERAGVAYYMDPELASARLNGKEAKLTTAGEQYAIAALVYEMLTGNRYLPFVVVRAEMLRQITEAEPRPMVGCAWSRVEAVIRRSLEKAPEARYPSVREMQTAFAQAMSDDLREASNARSPTRASVDIVNLMLDRARIEAEPDAPIENQPVCSVVNGAAGVALALHRIACAREDASTFALADLWAEKAAALVDHPRAFIMEEELTLAVIGNVSPYHTLSGAWFTRAFLAAERADTGTYVRNVDAFLTAVDAPCQNMDLTLGQSGVLLATALLLERAPSGSQGATAKLRLSANRTSALVADWLCARGPVKDDPELHYSGIAHGTPGMLYALMAWSRLSDAPIPDFFSDRIHQFAACGEPIGSGIRWPRSFRPSNRQSYFPSWCNGNGGLIPFWLLAASVLDEPRYLEMALRVGENTWEEPSKINMLCCGTAGQAYGLLALYQATGDPRWLRRAEHLGALAREGALALDAKSPTPFGLFTGLPGIAALIADLGRPEQAAMPAFGLGPEIMGRRTNSRE